MAVKKRGQAARRRGKIGKTRIKSAAGVANVEFGNVVVQGPKPRTDLLARNVKLGSESLMRAAETLIRPGVVLRPKKGVPQFFADSEHPGFYVRKLDGETVRGQLVEGVFVVVE